MLAAWVVLGLFMSVSTPEKLPVILLIVPFILLYIALYASWSLLDMLHGRYFVKEGKQKQHKSLGRTVSICVVMLLILQSLGQLTLRDVLTVFAIVVIGYLYLGRSRFVIHKR